MTELNLKSEAICKGLSKERGELIKKKKGEDARTENVCDPLLSSLFTFEGRLSVRRQLMAKKHGIRLTNGYCRDYMCDYLNVGAVTM